MGGDGARSPKVSRMEDCRLEKAFCALASDEVLRATVISTMLPDDIEGGRRMEGNSIYIACLAEGFEKWYEIVLLPVFCLQSTARPRRRRPFPQ